MSLAIVAALTVSLVCDDNMRLTRVWYCRSSSLAPGSASRSQPMESTTADRSARSSRTQSQVRRQPAGGSSGSNGARGDRGDFGDAAALAFFGDAAGDAASAFFGAAFDGAAFFLAAFAGAASLDAAKCGDDRKRFGAMLRTTTPRSDDARRSDDDASKAPNNSFTFSTTGRATAGVAQGRRSPQEP